jgi:predicted nucleic acid-binding protein
MKRFRAEGDFLVRALVDLISRCRAHLGRVEREFADLERLVAERQLPRDVLQAVLHLSRRKKGIGLSETELRARLNRLQELHILPEHRVQPGLNSDGQEDTS